MNEPAETEADIVVLCSDLFFASEIERAARTACAFTVRLETWQRQEW